MGVLQSGIIKFAQKLGFKGFTALNLAIIEDLAQQKAILEPKRPIHNKIHSDDSSLTIADEKQFRSSSISSRTAQNVITDLLFMTLLQLKSDKAKLLLNEISSAVERI